MADDPELQARVSKLEHDVQRAREDAAAARVLVGGVDRDVDDIRREFRQYRDQNTQLHNATRADIADMRGDIVGMTGEIVSLTGRMGSLENRVDVLTLEVRSKFDMVAAGQQQIVDLINSKFDERDL